MGKDLGKHRSRRKRQTLIPSRGCGLGKKLVVKVGEMELHGEQVFAGCQGQQNAGVGAMCTWKRKSWRGEGFPVPCRSC